MIEAPPMQAIGQETRKQISLESQIPRCLFIFMIVSVTLTIASFLFTIICRKSGLGLPYSFPYFYVPGDLFRDFRIFWPRFQVYHSYEFFLGKMGFFMYPAPLIFFYLPFFKSGHAFSLYLATVIALTSISVYAFAKIMRSGGLQGRALAVFVTTTVLLSYPLAFDYLRQNVEIVIFFLTAAGILAYWKGYSNVAAVFFGISGACKLYPLIFLGLLFAQKKYRSVALGVLVTVLLTLLSLWMLGPTVKQAYEWNSFALGLFGKRYAGEISHLAYDHSFLGLIKFLTLPWRPQLVPWVTPYTRIAAVLAVWFYFRRLIKMPAFNQLLALSILEVTLPPVSYDYTLLSLYPAFVVLAYFVVTAACLKRALATDVTLHFVLFAIIFNPLSFVTVLDGRYSGAVRSVCLIWLLWLAATRPILAPAVQAEAVIDAVRV